MTRPTVRTAPRIKFPPLLFHFLSSSSSFVRLGPPTYHLPPSLFFCNGPKPPVSPLQYIYSPTLFKGESSYATGKRKLHLTGWEASLLHIYKAYNRFTYFTVETSRTVFRLLTPIRILYFCSFNFYFIFFLWTCEFFSPLGKIGFFKLYEF